MKVVCDTNVLISGLLFGGHADAILRQVSAGWVCGYVSTYILVELEAVLGRPKFGLAPEQVTSLLELVQDAFLLVSVVEQVQVIKEDPSDNAILAAALAAGVDVIISGDKHLLSLKTYRGVRIVSPAEFVGEMEIG